MDHGTMNSPPAMSGGGTPTTMTKHYTHMTFFWGKNSEILFTGWPGTRGGMYALALVVVFVLAVVLEFFTHCRALTCPRSGCRRRRVAAGFVQTAGHAVRMGLAYLLMLAVMSFNGGVLIVAVVGHAVGFLLFGSSLFRGEVEVDEGGKGPCC